MASSEQSESFLQSTARANLSDTTVHAKTPVESDVDNNRNPKSPTGDNVEQAAASPAQQSSDQQQEENKVAEDDGTKRTPSDEDPKISTPDPTQQNSDQRDNNPTVSNSDNRDDDTVHPNIQTLAAELEHKLKTARREWRRLKDECNKSMKSNDGEESAVALYYQVDELYKSIMEDTA